MYTGAKHTTAKKLYKKKKKKKETDVIQWVYNELRPIWTLTIVLHCRLFENVAFEQKNLHRNDVRFAIVTRRIKHISRMTKFSCRFFRSLMIPNKRLTVVDKWLTPRTLVISSLRENALSLFLTRGSRSV